MTRIPQLLPLAIMPRLTLTKLPAKPTRSRVKHLACSAGSETFPRLVRHYPGTRAVGKIRGPAGCPPGSWLVFLAPGAHPSTALRRTLVTGRCRFAASSGAQPSNTPSRDGHRGQAWRYRSTDPRNRPQPVPMMAWSRTNGCPRADRSRVATIHMPSIARPGRAGPHARTGED